MSYNFKKILIALDASENAERAVDYVGEIAGSTPGFEVLLLHILRPPNRDHFPSEELWKQAIDAAEERGRDILRHAASRLEEKGMNSDAVRSKIIRPEGTSIAAEIMKMQQEEKCGTVVVGRRGVSKAEEFLFGSISNKVVHYARNCTVWVVE